LAKQEWVGTDLNEIVLWLFYRLSQSSFLLFRVPPGIILEWALLAWRLWIRSRSLVWPSGLVSSLALRPYTLILTQLADSQVCDHVPRDTWGRVTVDQSKSQDAEKQL
jgi:hypothetical protein